MNKSVPGKSPADGSPQASPLKVKLTAAASMLCATLASCDRVDPARVCAAPTTLDTVKDLLLRPYHDTAGLPLADIARVFNETTAIELITFEGRDKETGTVHCQAVVSSKTTGRQFPIAYSRQPALDSDFVYSIDYDRVAEWNAFGMGFHSRLVSFARENGRLAAEARETVDQDQNEPAQEASVEREVDLESAAPPLTTETDVKHAVRTEERDLSSRREDLVEFTGPPIIIPGPPPPAVAPPPSHAQLLRNPRWAIPPQPQNPAQAQTAGSVDLNCAVSSSGRLNDCRVVAERPRRQGFGAAALDATYAAVIAPNIGEPIRPNARTAFTIEFPAAN